MTRALSPELLGGAVLLAASLALPASGGAQEAEPVRLVQRADTCLSPRDAISAVEAGRAIPLGRAREVAETAGRGEMIRAELCAGEGRLHYVVTLLGGNGRVTRAEVDAGTGRLLGLR